MRNLLSIGRWLLLAWICWGSVVCMAQTSFQDAEYLVDLRSMRLASIEDLLKDADAADVVVLGEIHDNPKHHAWRGDLLRQLQGPTRSVVAEHLTAPHQLDAQQALLPALKQAGFDAKGWQWPLHEPLFAAVNERGWTLWGGNISQEDSRLVFKSKGESTPPALKTLLDQAPLNGQATKALQQEIDQGHCGALPAEMFEGMVAVQRARDASMAHAAMQHLPSLVLAGNGHAWKHLGVPQIIRANRPALNVLSVLLMEHEAFTTDADRQNWLNSLATEGDYLWVGPSIQRPDPCLSFRSKK